MKNIKNIKDVITIKENMDNVLNNPKTLFHVEFTALNKHIVIVKKENTIELMSRNEGSSVWNAFTLEKNIKLQSEIIKELSK